MEKDQAESNDQEPLGKVAETGLRRDRAAFCIVGMGGSAGGLEAFEQFFSHLPPDTGLAFVLVPHLEPTHKGMMPELLGRHTKMKVVQVEDGMKVRAELRLRDSPQRRPVHPARQTPGARTRRPSGFADADRLLLPAPGGRPERKGHRHSSFWHGKRRHPGSESHQGKPRDGDGARPGLGQVRRDAAAAPSTPA